MYMRLTGDDCLGIDCHDNSQKVRISYKGWGTDMDWQAAQELRDMLTIAIDMRIYLKVERIEKYECS